MPRFELVNEDEEVVNTILASEEEASAIAATLGLEAVMISELDRPPRSQRQFLIDGINAERDRRIRAGFEFAGNRFDFDDISKSRIIGAGALAGFAIAQGAVPGDVYWHGGDEPFEWVTADNTTTPLDAMTMFGVGQAAAEHERAHIFAARALKLADPIPEDFADDSWWP